MCIRDRLTADRPEDTGAAGLPICLQNDRSVLVERDVRAISATSRLAGTNDNRLDDVALLDVTARDRVLNGRDNGVTEARVAALRSPEHTNREQLLGAAVVGNLES